MLFNSITFFIFFPVVTFLYYVTPHKSRWLLLFLAGCYFYMCFIPAYVLLLFFLIVVDFLAAHLIEQSEGVKRKILLILSLCMTGIVLFYFKYHDFFLSSTVSIASQWGWQIPYEPLRWILPIGLSFHTFQSVAYVIEVYKRRYPAEKHIGYYAVYVLYFPQLVAGPIERPQHLLAQLHQPVIFTYVNAVAGLRLMLWGFFKKMVVADRLAVIVDSVYNHPSHWDGLTIVLATLAFALQIYGDFSGYTDIARGSAKMMGIDLMQNFKRPYIAVNISDFWRRWHISLSTWFRDYVYIPLGGNKQETILLIRNILITFLLSGLWHGANWTFLVWGGLNGAYLLIHRFWQRIGFLKEGSSQLSMRFPFLMSFFSWALTFMAINLSWVFFRAPSLNDAFSMLRHIVDSKGNSLLLDINGLFLLSTFAVVAIMLGMEKFFKDQEFPQWVAQFARWQRWSIYYAFIAAIVFLGVFKHRHFIYFQF